MVASYEYLTFFFLFMKILMQGMHDATISNWVNLVYPFREESAMLIYTMYSSMSAVHNVYIKKRFLKLLLELVFTAHTVPVVQVRYHFGEKVAASTVVVQYFLW